jgi:hypothetical protein
VSTHHHPSRRTFALALVLAGLASATVTEAGAAARSSTAPRQSAVQIIRVSTHEFDWGTAGIGAAAGVGISMLAVGGGLLITGTRRDRASLRRLTAKEQP